MGGGDDARLIDDAAVGGGPAIEDAEGEASESPGLEGVEGGLRVSLPPLGQRNGGSRPTAGKMLSRSKRSIQRPGLFVAAQFRYIVSCRQPCASMRQPTDAVADRLTVAE